MEHKQEIERIEKIIIRVCEKYRFLTRDDVSKFKLDLRRAASEIFYSDRGKGIPATPIEKNPLRFLLVDERGEKIYKT